MSEEEYEYDDDDDFSNEQSEHGSYYGDDFVTGAPSFADHQRTSANDFRQYWKTDAEGSRSRIQESDDRFRIAVHDTAKKLNVDDVDIEKLLFTSKELDRIQLKNPTAYVLGFFATAKNLTPASVQAAGERLKESDKESDIETKITDADIVRYARLWDKDLRE